MKAKSRASDLSSLADRMGYMLAVRAALAVLVVAWSALGPGIRVVSLRDLAFGSSLYVLISVSTESLRRRSGRRALWAVSLLLLVDGLYLAAATYVTGGTQSPLRFLTYLHVVAVTLLASFKTGLKIALWHSLLTFVMLYAQAAELIVPVDVAAQALRQGEAEFPRQSVLNVTAFWLFAMGTALLSALNERELRQGRLDLHALVEFGAKLDDATDPPDQARLLLDALGETFRFERGVVLQSNGHLSVLAYWGPGKPPFTEGSVDPVVRQVQRAKRPLLLKRLDAERDPTLASLLPLARNIIVAPMLAEGRIIGAVAVETGWRTAWMERRVLSIVGQFCSVAALNLRNASLLEQVRQLADTDPLTGLANRRVFESVLARELMHTERRGGSLALALLDLDHFKNLNDAYGHPTGDDVLRRVSTELNRACRAPDLVARYGGEEFAVILPDCSPEQALATAERIREAVASSPTIAPITASVGVATYPDGSSSVGDLIEVADRALYAAKRAGRNRSVLHGFGNGMEREGGNGHGDLPDGTRGAGGALLQDPPKQLAGEVSGTGAPMRANGSVGRLHLRAELERAVASGQLEVNYQPIVELRTDRIVAVEALARWKHPERGLLPPDEFIPLAEESDLIVALDSDVLRQACRDASEWRRRHPSRSTLAVTVNLSARQLQREHLVDDVNEILGEVGLDPSHLVLEITEGVLMRDMEAAVERLHNLKRLGVRLAIDDFGTGYSSLSYLRRLPLDMLKIDKLFLTGLGRGSEESALLKAIIELGHAVGLTTVAEGIEAVTQLDELREMGCRLGQGFYLSVPLGRLDLEAMLERQKVDPRLNGSDARPRVRAR